MLLGSLRTALVTALLAGFALPAFAQRDAQLARDDRIAELENTLAAVVDELASLREQVAVPETPELKASYGYAPAASKIYGIERGLSIGGYGEAFYRTFVDDEGSGPSEQLDDSDFLRMVLYFGYKFSDSIVFNSEIEFEHASTGETGSVSVEFAALDFFWKPWLNARAGILLLPMGFINEVHEPPFFYGVQRPLTERTLLPATWRENGLGIFGKLGETLEYRTYLVTGFDGADFSSSGLRGGRQKGSQSVSEDIAWVGRVDWTPLDGLLLGGSAYVGDADQDQFVNGVKLPDARLTMGELHAQYRIGAFHTRALIAATHLDDADELSLALDAAGEIDAFGDGPIAETMLGGYVEAAYDVWPSLFGGERKSLSPFFRVEYVDTQYDVSSGFDENRTRATWLFTPGLEYKPHPNVVLTAEYRNFQQRDGDAADELSFGIGFAF